MRHAVGDVVKFKGRSTSASLREKARGRTLCDSGFHAWSVESKRPFDVKLGRLVTLRRCKRCGITKTSLD